MAIHCRASPTILLDVQHTPILGLGKRGCQRIGVQDVPGLAFPQTPDSEEPPVSRWEQELGGWDEQKGGRDGYPGSLGKVNPATVNAMQVGRRRSRQRLPGLTAQVCSPDKSYGRAVQRLFAR